MEGFDFFDLMFVSGPVLKMIYSFGFKPPKEDFLEMTAEQYQKYYATEKEAQSEKLAYAATRLPDVFTEGTRFELYKQGHMYPIKSHEENL